MTPSSPETLGERLSTHVAKKASKLQQGYARNAADAVAELAILRRGVAQPPGQDAQLVVLTIAGLYDNPDGLPDEPTAAERAAYSALTLFAVHQQSHRGQSMHREGYSMGRSARLLARRSAAEEAVRARFTALATATTWAETMHHARGLVQQLRAYAIPLDYGQFARDLFDLQHARTTNRVRLAWGRHFYRVRDTDDAADDVTDENSDAATLAD